MGCSESSIWLLIRKRKRKRKDCQRERDGTRDESGMEGSIKSEPAETAVEAHAF